MVCRLCPRQCGVTRDKPGNGFCGLPWHPMVARYALHYWEEPPISGTHGSGAVFFSGCILRCSYCQNRVISRKPVGEPANPARLRDIFAVLVAQGAHNINLVSPTPYALALREALEEPLPVPVVWNTGGYERPETLRTLEGRVQIYLPDMKYMDRNLALQYSGAADYPEIAMAAIEEMVRQTGPYVLENGLLRRGVLIRHLLLPGALENTKRVLDWIAARFRPGEVLLSLMAQYTPPPDAIGLLSRRVTGAEYRAALAYLDHLGWTDGFIQERAAASTRYIPDFSSPS